MPPIDLNKTVVIVTGAARGLGRAMTLGLIEAGASVAALDLPSGDAEMAHTLALADAAGGRERIFSHPCDVTDSASCSAAVDAVLRHFGAVHGLVNNAGIGMQDFGPVQIGPWKKFYEHDVALWRRTIEVNVNGSFIMARSVAPLLVAQGRGRIVNIVTSLFATIMEGFSPYGPSKAALEAATVIWSKDLAGSGVTVNALLPGGPADTRMIPTGEIPDRSTLIQPQVMVAPIVWLMSSASDGVTGHRFIGKDWDTDLDPGEAALKAGAPAAW